MVDRIYLQRPDPAYTVSFVFGMASLVGAFLEQRVRRGLACTQDLLEAGSQSKTATQMV